MTCNGCGNKEATRIRIYHFEGKQIEICNICGGLGHLNNPDVYFPGSPYFDENLADADHKTGQYVYSRRHKAALLKKLNLVEAGDMKNKMTGKVTPFIKDPEKRRKYCIDNFGQEGTHGKNV